MSDFKGNKKIKLRPNDSSVAYTFRHTVATSSQSGWFPAGTTAISCSVVSYKKDGTDWTSVSDLIESYELSGNDVIVSLQYPSTNGDGRYRLSMALTINGTVKDSFFDNIHAESS